jgi:hypothetical protein
MLEPVLTRLAGVQEEARRRQDLAAGRGAWLTGLSRFVRVVAQSAVLGLGAYLVVTEHLGAGVMIAGSIMLGRGLAPVEQAIGSWKSLIATRAARPARRTCGCGPRAECSARGWQCWISCPARRSWSSRPICGRRTWSGCARA